MPTNRMTADEYRAHLASKPNKYGAKRTEYDGHTFASQAEADRYAHLRLMERAGLITGLRLQPRYTLQDGPRSVRLTYVADFAYEERGRHIVEDVKGLRLPVFEVKRRLFVRRFPELVLRVVRADGTVEEFGGEGE
jgi:hypothetical protein